MRQSLSTESFTRRRARELLERGLEAIRLGDYVRALHEFKASVFVEKSAEGLINWGWMEHELGDTERAIELCREAIAVEPDLGSPYNDIGSYLVALGRHREAIVWFERAIVAKYYVPRQYPHTNLGKVYLREGQYKKALHHFEQALHFAPNDPEILDLVRALRKKVQ